MQEADRAKTENENAKQNNDLRKRIVNMVVWLFPLTIMSLIILAILSGTDKFTFNAGILTALLGGVFAEVAVIVGIVVSDIFPKGKFKRRDNKKDNDNTPPPATP